MFTTFVASSGPPGATTTTTSSASSAPSQHDRPRPKRQQVVRACETCRVNRTKCDSTRPCSTCLAKGWRCTNRSTSDTPTLSSALNEISQLKGTINDLKSRLAQAAEEPRPASSCGSSNDARSAPSPLQKIHSISNPITKKPTKISAWRGWRENYAATDASQFYGPSSSLYFMARLRHSCGPSSCGDVGNDICTLSAAAMSSRHSLAVKMLETDAQSFDHALASVAGPELLSRAQQSFYISQFWQQHHINHPVLDEDSFEKHFESLWASRAASCLTREQSPLVDIMLAISIQFNSHKLSHDHGFHYFENDPGRQSPSACALANFHYHRSQRALKSDLQQPSLFTFQSQFFAVIYLYRSSLTSMAYNHLGMVIRIAYTLGLHQDPHESLPQVARELHRRIWWCLYILDTDISLELGRPEGVQLSCSDCGLPTDDQETATPSSRSSHTSQLEMTYLAFHLQCIQLFIVARSIYVEIYGNSKAIDDEMSQASSSEDTTKAKTARTAADLLQQRSKDMQSWADDLPTALKVGRRDGGAPLSCSNKRIVLDNYASPWLQRQRLLLELHYHNLTMLLHRPLMVSEASEKSSSNKAEPFELTCLNHATAITTIVHQICTESDLLNGTFKAQSTLWNAMITTIGFWLAHKESAQAESTSKYVGMAMEVFRMFGSQNSMASTGAAIASSFLASLGVAKNGGRVNGVGQDVAMEDTGSSGLGKMILPGGAGRDRGRGFAEPKELLEAGVFAPLGPGGIVTSAEAQDGISATWDDSLLLDLNVDAGNFWPTLEDG